MSYARKTDVREEGGSDRFLKKGKREDERETVPKKIRRCAENAMTHNKERVLRQRGC